MIRRHAAAARWALLAAVWIWAGAGCGPKTASGVADKFMDLYFIEFDQERLLPLTTGLAKGKIQAELRLVHQIRNDLGHAAAASKSDMRYRRISGEVTARDAQFSYAVTIRGASNRIVSLALHHNDGAWRVGNFTIDEGETPAGK